MSPHARGDIRFLIERSRLLGLWDLDASFARLSPLLSDYYLFLCICHRGICSRLRLAAVHLIRQGRDYVGILT